VNKQNSYLHYILKRKQRISRKATVKEYLTVQKEDKTQIDMQFECDSVLLNKCQLIELFEARIAQINSVVKESLTTELEKLQNKALQV